MNISKNEGRLESASIADETSISMVPRETKDAQKAGAEGNLGIRGQCSQRSTRGANSKPISEPRTEKRALPLQNLACPDGFAVSAVVAPRGLADFANSLDIVTHERGESRRQERERET